MPSPAATGTQRWVLLETAPWGHRLRLPGEHLARWLCSKGHRVAYVSAPVSPWHFLSRNRRALALQRWRISGVRGRWHSENLFVYVPRTLLPIHASGPFDTQASWLLSEALSMPRASAVLKRAGFSRPDVLLMQNFQIHQLAEILEPRVLGVRIEDRLDHFPAMPRVIVRNLPRLLPGADFCTVTARTLEPYAKEQGARSVLYLPNGVDAAVIARPERLPPRPEELPPGPVAIYTGTIDRWFDAELLLETATRRSDWNFVLVGPVAAHRERLSSAANVFLLPARPQEELAPLLWHSDVGMIPFERSPLIESVAPLKLFEYLAAGLPVVSTRWEEIELLASPAALCDDAAGFAEAIERAASAGTPEARAQWAQAYDWRIVFEAFAQEIAVMQGG